MTMTGFEPGSSGVESDNSANCVATTDQCCNENRNIKQHFAVLHLEE